MTNSYHHFNQLLQESVRLNEANELVQYLEHLTSRSTPTGPANLFLEHNIISVQNGVEIYSLDPQLLQEFKLRFKVPKIDFKKIKDRFTDSMKKMEDWLEKKGVPIAKVKIFIKRVAKKIMTVLKSVKSKADAKAASAKLQKIFIKAFEDAQEADFWDQVVESARLLFLVLLVNSLVNTVILILVALTLGPAIAPALSMALTAIIVAPFTEEVAKNLALRRNYPWIYVTFFAWAELLMYVSAGVPFIIRLLPLAMHYGTVWVQKYMYERGLERGDTESDSASAGLKLGIVIHSFWNTLAILAHFYK
jgi:hypothetical protein